MEKEATKHLLRGNSCENCKHCILQKGPVCNLKPDSRYNYLVDNKYFTRIPDENVCSEWATWSFSYTFNIPVYKIAPLNVSITS